MAADHGSLRKRRPCLAAGVQSATGVPLMCDEPAEFRSFRIGLFGLDKLHDPDAAVARLAEALDRIGG